MTPAPLSNFLSPLLSLPPFLRLAEVGKLEPVKLHGNYDTGQTFLHSLFGYRGVILFPWLARVYDRSVEFPHPPQG